MAAVVVGDAVVVDAASASAVAVAATDVLVVVVGEGGGTLLKGFKAGPTGLGNLGTSKIGFGCGGRGMATRK